MKLIYQIIILPNFIHSRGTKVSVVIVVSEQEML